MQFGTRFFLQIKGQEDEQLKCDLPPIYQAEDGKIIPLNKLKSFESVISLKAETHNFPTTVEPFNGAATGSGGEISFLPFLQKHGNIDSIGFKFNNIAYS